VRYGSEHVGGAHFLMADGAVRFISESIDHKPSQAGVPTGYQPDLGCWWTSAANGCADGAPGVFMDKTALANVMGLYQRLHHKNDGLTIGDF
jgi:prepilin-type processing-associated H-X9-DG protein